MFSWIYGLFVLLMCFIGSSVLLSGFEKHSCEEELTKLLPPGYKLSVNQEWVKVYYADTKEPYRSWTINYSDGLIYDGNGNWKSLYREPTMSHVDMKGFGVKRETRLHDSFGER